MSDRNPLDCRSVTESSLFWHPDVKKICFIRRCSSCNTAYLLPWTTENVGAKPGKCRNCKKKT